MIGAGLDVWEVVQAYQDFDSSTERLVASSHLAESDVALALAYHEQFPEEVDSLVEENKMDPTELNRRYPMISLA